MEHSTYDAWKSAVKTKRLPKAPETEENKEMIMKLTAARQATGQKTGLMTTIAKKDFAGNTSLEMFGVSEYGREKVRGRRRRRMRRRRRRLVVVVGGGGGGRGRGETLPKDLKSVRRSFVSIGPGDFTVHL